MWGTIEGIPICINAKERISILENAGEITHISQWARTKRNSEEKERVFIQPRTKWAVPPFSPLRWPKLSNFVHSLAVGGKRKKSLRLSDCLVMESLTAASVHVRSSFFLSFLASKVFKRKRKETGSFPALNFESRADDVLRTRVSPFFRIQGLFDLPDLSCQRRRLGICDRFIASRRCVVRTNSVTGVFFLLLFMGQSRVE